MLQEFYTARHKCLFCFNHGMHVKHDANSCGNMIQEKGFVCDLLVP